MTIGTGYFLPQGQFSVQRSFITAVAFDGIFPYQVGTPPNFIFNPVTEPMNYYYINFLPEFWEWSSNSYTLDHLVIVAYKVALPDPTPIPYDYRLNYKPATATTPACVHLLPHFYTSSPVYYDMPARDQPYWLPDL